MVLSWGWDGCPSVLAPVLLSRNCTPWVCLDLKDSGWITAGATWRGEEISPWQLEPGSNTSSHSHCLAVLLNLGTSGQDTVASVYLWGDRMVSGMEYAYTYIPHAGRERQVW